jgi:hypothetical protein
VRDSVFMAAQPYQIAFINSNTVIK